jgi:periplasmic divalent cation tolerance protein
VSVRGGRRASAAAARRRRGGGAATARHAAAAAVVVLSTAGSRAEADRIAAALVDERLAACVNVVGPLTSIYRWRGAVERAEEVLLVVKTRRTLVARVAARIRALHSYELPEAIALAIEGGSAPYLAWIAGETESPRPARVARSRRGRASARRR